MIITHSTYSLASSYSKNDRQPNAMAFSETYYLHAQPSEQQSESQ